MSAQNTFIAHTVKLSHDGRGIAYLNGKTLFIDGALPDEEVRFVYTSQKSKYSEGKVVEVLTASPVRTAPLCQHYAICGGCSLQHIRAAAQIELKQQLLLEQLAHLGGVTPEEVLPPLTGPHWGYRRKARIGVKHVAKKQKLLVGFREKNGRYLADLERCEILHPKIGACLTEFGELITQLDGYQTIPQIEVAMGDILCALVFRHMHPLSQQDQAKLVQFAQKYNFQVFLQPGGEDSIHPLWPENPQPLAYTLPDFDITLQFHPADFTQVNIDINRLMVNHALELLAPEPTDRILDLFCGLGNFTLPLAKFSKTVIGVEGSTEMVKRAYDNAGLNAISNVEFYAANLAADFSVTPWFQRGAKEGFDKILLDPPRTGAIEVIQRLSAFSAARIVYVSCNPATLARDAGVLVTLGYRLVKVGAMDMFPHTRHVEAIAVFDAKRIKQKESL